MVKSGKTFHNQKQNYKEKWAKKMRLQQKIYIDLRKSFTRRKKIEWQKAIKEIIKISVEVLCQFLTEFWVLTNWAVGVPYIF